MLAIVGLITILLVLTLIMTKKLSTMSALIAIPILACLFLGQAGDLGKFMLAGIKNVAPTGAMFIFAVLFFTIMGDAGVFERIVNKIIGVVGSDPIKVCVGTFVITMFCHLDGSGAATFLIVIPAMLPIFDKLKMDRRILATIVALGAGTMNMLPWGGPTLRAATALDVPVMELFNPMMLPQICGLIAGIAIAVMFGIKEKRRLGVSLAEISVAPMVLSEEEQALRRPKLFWFNLVLIIATVAVMVEGSLPPVGCFMAALVIMLMVNYPDVKLQGKLIDAHAKEALMMASVLFAAGIFTGIMKGSGMIDAMAKGLVAIMPDALAPHFAVIIGVISMPASLLFDPDSFYFAVLPVLAQAANAVGLAGIDLGRAAICGEMTLGFPISPLTPATFLLIGLAGIDLGDHQKHTFFWAWLVSLVVLIAAILVGTIPL
ncbi:CitMHS family transporter [Megasphaera hominis]|jgi:CitMHS family citrate-Mg2+:H+ or citrate-Ca2+:H+ symporter|uniref:Citrate transporter n=1 Tax=Megasphaera hominis TaxID=159836 RepID=A0ABR6VJC4_9FIRM|nr:citrate:proton symporter [Megasphaera hominis]MBC3536814.1 citrate transporter [Megasphaera hominis]